MTIDKEIRCVALKRFQPDGDKLNAELDMLERIRPEVRIKYRRDNCVDVSCMEIWLGLKVIGYVNADDKRYVEPILRESGSCPARFLEVYREEGHTPIVRFLVMVDLDEVMPIKAGAEWEKWEYTFAVVPMIDDLSTVGFTGDMLKEMLMKGKMDDCMTVDELMESFVKASMFDMSVETTRRYDDLLFFLETSRQRNRNYINMLQQGSTVRRTDRMREKFLQEWWPGFMASEVARRLYKSFATDMERKHGGITEACITMEYDNLHRELMMMPHSLSDDMNDIATMWAKMYYTNIPRKKFIEVLSAITLYTRLKETIEKKKPFIVEETNKTYIQNFESGSNAHVVNM